MSRTHRKHVPLSQLRSTVKGSRSAVALAAIEKSGSGIHTKSHKQRRVNERAALRQDWR
jgi:hypothetical protein